MDTTGTLVTLGTFDLGPELDEGITVLAADTPCEVTGLLIVPTLAEAVRFLVLLLNILTETQKIILLQTSTN